MKGLLMKDLYMVTNFKKQYGLIFLFMGGWCVFTRSFSFFAMYAILLGGMMTFSIMAMDEAVHFDRYALTMPISVKTLIKEKYAMTCICVATGTLLAVLIECIAMLTPWHEGATEWISLAIMSTFFLLAYTISLPIIFKYGVEKARYIYIAVMGGMAVVVVGIVHFAKDTPVMLYEVTPAVPFLLLLAGILLAVDAVVVAASYQVSVRVVRGKEW